MGDFHISFTFEKMVAIGTQICELKNTITDLTLLTMYGWLAGSHFGSKREANAKITHKSHQLQLVARNFSFGTFKDEQKILA